MGFSLPYPSGPDIALRIRGNHKTQTTTADVIKGNLTFNLCLLISNISHEVYYAITAQRSKTAIIVSNMDRVLVVFLLSLNLNHDYTAFYFRTHHRQSILRMSGAEQCLCGQYLFCVLLDERMSTLSRC